MQTVKLGIINGPVPHSRTLEFQIAWRAWLGLVPIAPADHGFAAQLTPENMSVPHCRILVLANVSAQVLACFVPWSRKLALARRNMAALATDTPHLVSRVLTNAATGWFAARLAAVAPVCS